MKPEPVHLIFGIALAVSLCPSVVLSISTTLQTSRVATFPLSRQCTWLYRGNPKDCKSYYQCMNGRPVLRHCPRGLHWNAESSSCDWKMRSNCKVGSGKVPTGSKPQLFHEYHYSQKGESKQKAACQPNTYSPHPTDCNKYIMCGTNGQENTMTCTPGLHWDPLFLVCNWPEVANCRPSGATSAPTQPTTPSPPPSPPPPTQPQPPQKPQPQKPQPTTKPPVLPTSPPTVTTVTPFTTPPTTAPTTARPTTAVTVPTTPPTTSITTTLKPTPPAGDNSSSSTSGSGYKVVCYFTGWAVYRPSGGSYAPSDIDSSLCTHIIYAFACMNDRTYKLEMCDSWIDGSEGKNFYGQVTAFRKLGVKVLIAVGGWNDSAYRKWSEMLKDVIKMETFIQSVIEFLRIHQFDGLDLDYEYPSCPQANCNFDSKFEKQGFVALVKGLRLRCPPQTILSAAVSCNENIIREAYDVPTLSKHLDFFNLMAYDFHGAWEPVTGINAPLYKLPQGEYYLTTYHAVQTFIGMKAPPEKLCLGMPMYGQSFKLADVRENGIGAKSAGPGDPGQWTRQKGMLAYYEICSQPWTNTVHDEERRVGPYRYNATNGQWVSYDAEVIIKEKCKIVKELGLGGGMIWALDLDDYRNICGGGRYPLLNAIKEELLGPQNKRREVKPQRTQKNKQRRRKPARN